jgi:hypothetical protein
MADNVSVDNGTGTDYTVATDDDGTAQHQLVKIEFGPNGTFTPVSAANPLPTTDAAVQTQDATYSAGAVGVTGGVRRDADTTPVSADGDVHPLVFEETGRLKVATYPGSVSTYTDTITVNGDTVALDVSRYSNVVAHCTGTFSTANCTFEGSIDGGTTWFGVQAVRTNANTIETTTGNLSAAPAYGWELSVNALSNFRVRATAFTSGTQTWRFAPGTYATEPIPAAQISGTQPVSGTVAVSTIAGAITAGTAATSLGKAEDAVAASGDTGVFVLAVQRAAPASNVSATGDYAEFQMSPANGLFVAPTPITVDLVATPTISNGSIYASGDVVGAALTFTNAALASGRAFQIVESNIRDLGRQAAALELWLFKVSPTLVNADNGVFEITDGYFGTALPFAVFDFATANYHSTAANVSFCKGTLNGGPSVVAGVTSGSANIFGALVSRGTPTYTSTSDLVVTLTITQF